MCISQTMFCSDVDPTCVSYPTVVSALQGILVSMAAKSIGYGISVLNCAYILSPLAGCFIIVAVQAVYYLM